MSLQLDTIVKIELFPELHFFKKLPNFVSLSWKLDNSYCHVDYAYISGKVCL